MAIHYRDGRSSDFLAGVDLEAFVLKGLSCKLTVSKVDFHKVLSVNGRDKKNALVLTFDEPYAKPLIVNTTNSQDIKDATNQMDAEKWVGISIEFFYKKKGISMKVSRTETKEGGIRIKSIDTNGLFPDKQDIDKRIDYCSNEAELMDIWYELSENDQNKYKEKVVEKRKTI